MASVSVDHCERQPAFGHFETVRLTGTRILRWLAYLALTGVLGAMVGHPWTLIWGAKITYLLH